MTAVLAPLVTEPPRLDEPGRRVSIPVSEGTNLPRFVIRTVHAVVRRHSDGVRQPAGAAIRTPLIDATNRPLVTVGWYLRLVR